MQIFFQSKTSKNHNRAHRNHFWCECTLTLRLSESLQKVDCAFFFFLFLLSMQFLSTLDSFFFFFFSSKTQVTKYSRKKKERNKKKKESKESGNCIEIISVICIQYGGQYPQLNQGSEALNHASKSKTFPHKTQQKISSDFILITK